MDAARHWLVVAGLLGGSAVALGALGAHGLKTRAESDWPVETRAGRLANWATASEYQMYHALALIGVAVTTPSRRRWGNAAGLAMTGGTTIFSGCLYAYALTGAKGWGAVVPIGGVLLIAGWCCLLVSAIGRDRP